MSSGLLAGRTVLVTGAANGIGRAIVERFVSEGARVVGVDREPITEGSDAVTALLFDLANTSDLPALLSDAEAAVGPIDVLVNNAGIFEPMPALEASLESYRRVLAINLEAPIFLAVAAARGMVERGYGRIVNVTSIHGQFGEELTLSYDTAKAGLNQATRTLAVELGPAGVLVNAVAPGFVLTRWAMTDGRNDLESEWFRSIYVEAGKLPLRRYALPPEIAAQVAWLASEQNTYMTGQVVTVDGGLTVTF